MSDPIPNLLNKLDQVRETKPDHWIARCSAHEDKNPSLSIARGDDGRVLLRCWAGCSALEIVQSVGLTLADLFERTDHVKPGRKRLYPNYRSILKLLRHEITVILISASDMNQGKPVSDADMETTARAYRNINKVLEAANV